MKNVAEHYSTFQLEGKTIGTPAYFIRFAGCNLKCTYCDEPASRLQHGHTVQFTKEQKHMHKASIPLNCNKIVFTGGEPMLQPLSDVIKELEDSVGRTFNYEVETNGLITPNHDLLQKIKQWNVSPKLYDGIYKKVNFDFWGCLTETSIFKFVLTEKNFDKESSIIESLLEKIPQYQKRVYLMAEGETRKKQIKRADLVMGLATKLLVNYSLRGHILLKDTEKGI